MIRGKTLLGKIKINRKLWKIYVVSSNVMKKEDRDKQCIGLCIPNTKQIYLHEQLSTRKMYKTLIHEIIHATLASYNKLTNGIYQKISDKDEEDLCYALAYTLHNFFNGGVEK